MTTQTKKPKIKHSPISIVIMFANLTMASNVGAVILCMDDALDKKMCNLGTLRTDHLGSSSAAALSAEGSTVVGAASNENGESRAFIWRVGDSKITDIGTLRVDNSGKSFARAVSADGSTVVGGSSQDNVSEYHAFIWRVVDSKITDLGTLRTDNSGFSNVMAVSANGSAVIGEADTSSIYSHAFLWREGDAKMRDLGTLRTDNSGYSIALAISADGAVVIGNASNDDFTTHAFYWREGDVKMRDVGTLKTYDRGYSFAKAVSLDGSTVVGDADNDDSEVRAFYWREGDAKMRDLGSLRTDNLGYSGAKAVSADGFTVVGVSRNDNDDAHAFLWRDDGSKMTDLGTLRGNNSGDSDVVAVSADGSTVVGDADNDKGEYHAFRWHDGDLKMTDLGTLKSDNTGNSVAVAVSTDGKTVVGNAQNDMNQSRAFLWRDSGNGSGVMQDMNNLFGSYHRLSDQTELAVRSQQRVMGHQFDQTCFTDKTGGNCIKVAGIIVGTPSNSTSWYSVSGRSKASFGALSYGHGITNQFTVGGTVSVYGTRLTHSGVDMDAGWGVGAFGQYSQGGQAHTSWQTGVVVGYGSQSMDIIRGQGLRNVQYGLGNKYLSTFAMRLSVGYGFALDNIWLVTPNIDVTHYRSSRGEYTERGDGLVLDTHYNRLHNNITVASLGVMGEREKGEDRSRLQLGVGLDVDLSVNNVDLSGQTNAFTLGSSVKDFAFSSNMDRNKVRPYAQVGYSYMFKGNIMGTIGTNLRVSLPEYGNRSVDYTLGLNYTVKF